MTSLPRTYRKDMTFGELFPDGEQLCRLCGELKVLEEFYPIKGRGLDSRCKDCESNRNKQRRKGRKTSTIREFRDRVLKSSSENQMNWAAPGVMELLALEFPGFDITFTYLSPSRAAWDEFYYKGVCIDSGHIPLSDNYTPGFVSVSRNIDRAVNFANEHDVRCTSVWTDQSGKTHAAFVSHHEDENDREYQQFFIHKLTTSTWRSSRANPWSLAKDSIGSKLTSRLYLAIRADGLVKPGIGRLGETKESLMAMYGAVSVHSFPVIALCLTDIIEGLIHHAFLERNEPLPRGTFGRKDREGNSISNGETEVFRVSEQEALDVMNHLILEHAGVIAIDVNGSPMRVGGLDRAEGQQALYDATKDQIRLARSKMKDSYERVNRLARNQAYATPYGDSRADVTQVT